jgi:hypothetical protein
MKKAKKIRSNPKRYYWSWEEIQEIFGNKKDEEKIKDKLTDSDTKVQKSNKISGKTSEKPLVFEQDEEFSKITQISLYIVAAFTIFAQWRIESHDIRLLFSLCMIIGAAVGRYGSDHTYNMTKFPKDGHKLSARRITYNILVIFGILGLLF